VNSKTYTRKYAYNGSNIIAEYDGSNVLLAKYTHSPLSADDLLAADISSQGVAAGISNQSGVLYYLKDYQNTVTEIANEAGIIIQKFEYSSFGEIQKIKDGSDNAFTFNKAPVKTSFTYTGREFEPETGLYYYRARYYDSSNGRFLQQDPDPGVLKNPVSVFNKYIYTNNKPTYMVDPDGRFPWLVIAAISLAVTAFENNKKGGNFLGQFAVNFAVSSLMYLAGVQLGGAEFSATATWQQSLWTASKSLATSSVVRAAAWEAQSRRIASDGTTFAFAFLYGVGDNYKAKELNWESVSTAIGNTLTFPNPSPSSIEGSNIQIPKTGDLNDGN